MAVLTDTIEGRHYAVGCYFFEFNTISRKITCRYSGVIGECPCEWCKHYVGAREVENLARDMANERMKNGGVIK